MKVYTLSYSINWKFGGYESYEYIVIANTKSEALGLALEAKKDTKAKHWEITEIPTDVVAATYITSDHS